MPLKLGTQDVTLKLGSQDVTAYLGAEEVSAFDPTSIEGLVGWYDSLDLTAMAQNSDGTGVVAVGDPVGYWADKSGAGNHVTQATPANRPTATASAVNGKTALVFDGSNDSLSRTGYTSQTSLSGLTRIMVVSSSQVSMATRTLTSGLAEAGGGQCFFTTGSSPAVIRCSINTYHLDVARQGDTIPLRVYESVYDGAAGTMKTFYSGTEVASGAGAPATTSATAGPILWIGSNVGINNFINGPIAEYLIYDRALTTTERQKIEGWLAWRWGLQAQLPSNHPYAYSFPGFGSQARPDNGDALAWESAVYSNSGSVSVGTLAAVNTFCAAIDAAGIRDRFYRLNLFCGDSDASLVAVRVPLYRGPSLGGTQYGNALDTNNNFVQGDYAETGATGGLKGNGSSKYLDTGFAANVLGQTDRHMSAFFDLATSVSNRYWFGTDQSGCGSSFWAIGSSSTASAEFRCGIPGAGSVASSGKIQLLVSGNGTAQSYLNGSASTSVSGAAFTAPAQNIFVHALNRCGSPTDFGSCRVQAYSLGAAFTAQQAADFYTAILAFQAAMGRV
jgi:hypothetical protein